MYRWFIAPLMKDVEVESYLLDETRKFKCEVFFGIQTCRILLVEAETEFQMVGMSVDDNQIHRNGMPVNRRVKQGDRLFIRFDKNRLDRIDMQFTTKRREDNFRLTHVEFNQIKDYLKVIK